jgi:hypothetical protein
MKMRVDLSDGYKADYSIIEPIIFALKCGIPIKTGGRLQRYAVLRLIDCVLGWIKRYSHLIYVHPLNSIYKRESASFMEGLFCLPPHRPAFFFRKSPLHRSEQVFTLSQSRAHFLRQAKGRAQASQIFSGRLDLVYFFSVIGCPETPPRWL